MVTGGKDCAIIFWDLEKGQKDIISGSKYGKESCGGHTNEIRTLAISPNGKMMATGGKDNLVRIWDIQSRKQIHKFVGHRDTVTGLKFDISND